MLVNVTVEKINDLFDPLIRNLPQGGSLDNGNPVGEGWADLLE